MHYVGRFDPRGSLESKNTKGFDYHQRYSIDEELAESFLMQFKRGQINFVCERNCWLKLWTKRRLFSNKSSQDIEQSVLHIKIESSMKICERGKI